MAPPQAHDPSEVAILVANGTGGQVRGAAGRIAESPLTDHVAAISVGLVDGLALLDLPYIEDAAADVDMNVVMSGSGQLIEIQGTGEECTFSRAQLNALLDLAESGCASLVAFQTAALDG